MCRKLHILLIVVLAAVLVSCAAHSARPSASASAGQFSIEKGIWDIQPGWRFRVVTPVTKSGSFKVVSTVTETNGDVLTLKASDDLLGYETSYYSVLAKPRGGVSVRFTAATVTRDGKETPQERPLVRFFDLPDNARYLRMLFLTRISRADHDQGFIAAPTPEGLEQLTKEVLDDPEHNCKPDQRAFCFWIPAGVSVQPEKKNPKGGEDWIPAT